VFNLIQQVILSRSTKV